MSEIIAKMVVKVYLVGGNVIEHIYPVPTSNAEMTKHIKEMVDRTLILRRGETGYLYFENPSISYNPDNVLAIELTSIGVTQLAKILEKAQTKIGLVK